MSDKVVSALINQGPIGLILLLILSGQLVPRWVVNRLERENDELKQSRDLERSRADTSIQTATTATKALLALRDVARERDSRRRGDRDLTSDDIFL